MRRNRRLSFNKDGGETEESQEASAAQPTVLPRPNKPRLSDVSGGYSAEVEDDLSSEDSQADESAGLLMGAEGSQETRDRRHGAEGLGVEAKPSSLVVFCNLMQGCGLMMPWNSLVTALDYFKALFPYDDPANWFAIANTGGCLVFLLLELALAQRVAKASPGQLVSCGSMAKVIVGLIMMMTVLGFALFMAFEFDAPITEGGIWFATLIAATALTGAGSAIVQSVTVSLAGQLSPSCVAANVTGQALSGLLTCACRICSKIFFQHLQPFDALRQSTIIYLIVSICIVLVALACFLLLVRLARLTPSKERLEAEDESANLIGGEEPLGSPTSALRGPGSKWLVYKSVMPYCIGGFLDFFVTLALFPAITSSIPPASEDPMDWMPVILITCFNVADVLGRVVSGSFQKRISIVLIALLVVLRIGFIPVFLYLKSSQLSAGGWHNQAAYLSTLLMAFSNGFLATAMLMRGQASVREGSERNLASTALILALTIGLAAGAVTAGPLRNLRV